MRKAYVIPKITNILVEKGKKYPAYCKDDGGILFEPSAGDGFIEIDITNKYYDVIFENEENGIVTLENAKRIFYTIQHEMVVPQGYSAEDIEEAVARASKGSKYKWSETEENL